MSASCALEREDGEGEKSSLLKRDLLGATCPGVGGLAGQDCSGGISSWGSWGKSDGENVYGGRVGQVAVSGVMEGGMGESEREHRSTGWARVEGRLDYRCGKVCASRQSAEPKGERSMQ